MESALFGFVYLDADRRAQPESLASVAAIMGLRDSDIRAEGPFAVGVHWSAVDALRGTSSIAVDGARSSWAAVTGDIENRDDLVDGLATDEQPDADADDAALVLALVRKHGDSFMERLEGSFNIAIWNARRRELTLVTDHCGALRPIYYHRGHDFLAFGSTAKAVIGQGGVPRAVDPVGLDQMLAFAHPVAPRTLFKGVGVLPGGTLLKCCGRRMQVRRYRQHRPFRDTGEDLGSLRERYFSALTTAVDRIIGQHSGLGIFLSGGVDSAALVSLLHRAGCEHVKTFFVHAGNEADSDREAARRIAARYGTEHRTIDASDARCLQHLPDMLWHYESPGQNFQPTYLLCREAGNHCSTVLGGYGNDLVWGVVPPVPWDQAWLLRATPVIALLRYMRRRRALPRRQARHLYAESPATDLGLLAALARYAVRTGNPVTDFICLDESLFGDQRVCRELGKFVFDAHSLRMLTPYTNAAVTAVAERVPPAARFGSRNDSGTRRKGFFKDVMNQNRVLPPDIIYRKKNWMRSPAARWLRGDFGVLVGELLFSRNARIGNWFDSAVVDQVYREHRAGAADHSYVLATLTAFEIWHRLFIDPPSIQPPRELLSDFTDSALLFPSCLL